MPTKKRKNVERFIVAARAFCRFMEQGAKMPLDTRVRAARRHLAELYAAACLLPIGKPDKKDVGATRGVLSGGDWPEFDAVDEYWEIFDPYENEEPVGFQISIDLLEIYDDLRRGFAMRKAGASEAATIWEWRFQFDIHWGAHAIDALRALHRAVERVKEK